MTTKTILVAHDFSQPATRALVWAYNLSRALPAQLQVVHVHPDIYDVRGQPALGLPWPTEGQEERYLRFLDEELLRALRAEIGAEGERVIRHVVRGEPVKRILALAEEIGADMICLGSTGKGAVDRALLGSASLSTLRKSKVPVAIIP